MILDERFAKGRIDTIEMGTPFPVVQAQTGHPSKRMTELDTHISQRAMEDAARRYEQRKVELFAEAKKRLLERPCKRESTSRKLGMSRVQFRTKFRKWALTA